MTLQEKLAEMGLTLPEAPAPVGAYVPVVRTGNLIFTSGQLPLVEGSLRFAGRVGVELTIEEGYEAARICALNALAAVGTLTDLSRVIQVVKVTGFVNCGPEFTMHARVINGASDMLSRLFAGGHARAAVGVASLPLGAAVELEMIVEVES